MAALMATLCHKPTSAYTQSPDTELNPVQARILYSVLFAGAVMENSRWERAAVHVALGNLRLMNAAGYFQTSVRMGEVVAAGWRRFFDDDSHNENLYYQSAGRAVMLMMHALTQHSLFLNRTRCDWTPC